MNGPQLFPDDWPVDREVEYLERKLGPFEDHGDWQQKRGDERTERLGDEGRRLASSLGLIQTFMEDYDMTPEEAIACLQYEINHYHESAKESDGK